MAIEDFERACADDPDNLALRKLLKQACDKFEEVRCAASFCTSGSVTCFCRCVCVMAWRVHAIDSMA